MHDIYCYGMISSSTVIVLDKKFRYPEANTYAEIAETLPSVGGEAVNSAIILSKLGVKTRLDGNWLNLKNEKKITGLLKPFGIDISPLRVTDNFGTEEVVIADSTTRTVFGNYAAFHSGEKQWNSPDEDDIKSCKLAVLDPYFREESDSAAKLCVKHNIPYVTLDCRFEDFIAQNAEALVISHELRDQSYPEMNPQDLFTKYRQNCKGLVIFTFGSDDLWYARGAGEILKFTPFKIEPVDTTGAGDSFRGAIAFGLYKGWDDLRTIEFASAVAANVCLSYPHTLNAPGLKEISNFINERKHDKKA